MNEQNTFELDQNLFDETGNEIVRRLRGARSQDDLLDVAKWGAREMNRTFCSTDKKFKATIQCKSGCDFCCHVPMAVQAHEIFAAADFIKKRFSKEDIAGVITRTESHKARVTGLGTVEYNKLVQPCSLLKNRSCSIYEARPEVCRAHHANDAKICEASLGNDDLAAKAYILPLRSRMFGVMLGIDQAFAEAGYDGRAYDFGSALYEALTDNQCMVNWMNKKQAFSDSCREPSPIEGGQHGEFQAKKRFFTR
jgi:Fe-S-cluster containining protein